MSVLTLERHSEEFPELAAACQMAFAGSIASSSCTIPARPSRTTPVSDIVTMEDVGQHTGVTATMLRAAKEFAAVAMMEVPNVASVTPLPTPPAPKAACFTTEDGGQSMGARETSARAAMLLADLDEEAPAPRSIPNYRPCNSGPAYCC